MLLKNIQVFRKWFDRNDSIDSNLIERTNTQLFLPLLMSLLIISLAQALVGSRLNCSGFEGVFPKTFVKVIIQGFVTGSILILFRFGICNQRESKMNFICVLISLSYCRTVSLCNFQDYCWSQGIYTNKYAYNMPRDELPAPGIIPCVRYTCSFRK